MLVQHQEVEVVVGVVEEEEEEVEWEEVVDLDFETGL